MPPHSPALPVAHASGIRRFDQARALSASVWQFDWIFSADDRAFDGHFPHQPVLAGVFLVEMAQRAAEYALAMSGLVQLRLTRVQRFRFFSPVLPGDTCTLLLDWPPELDPGAPIPVTAIFSKHGHKLAHGRLLLCAGAPLAEEKTNAH